jgi:hypothetical protein
MSYFLFHNIFSPATSVACCQFVLFYSKEVDSTSFTHGQEMSLNVPSSNRVKNYLPKVHSEGKIIDLIGVYL